MSNSYDSTSTGQLYRAPTSGRRRAAPLDPHEALRRREAHLENMRRHNQQARARGKRAIQLCAEQQQTIEGI